MVQGSYKKVITNKIENDNIKIKMIRETKIRLHTRQPNKFFMYNDCFLLQRRVAKMPTLLFLF